MMHHPCVVPPEFPVHNRVDNAEQCLYVMSASGVELVLFAMAAGERLSEHTSARPAMIHVLSGEAELTAAGESHDAGPGAWLRMPIRMAHAIVARTDLVFALYLLPA